MPTFISGSAAVKYQQHAHMLGGYWTTGSAGQFSSLPVSGAQVMPPNSKDMSVLPARNVNTQLMLSSSFSGVSGSVIQALNYLHSKASAGDGDVVAGDGANNQITYWSDFSAQTIASDADLRFDGQAFGFGGTNGTTFDVNATALTLDGTSASNLTTTAADLTVSTATSGELIINSAGILDIDSAAAMELNSQTTIVIGAVDDSSFIVDKVAKDLSLAVTGGGAQVLQLASAGTGTDAIDINATAGGVDVVAAGAIALDAADDSNLTVAGSAKTLTLAVSGGSTNKLIMSSAGTGTDAIDIDASAGGIDIDAPAAFDVDISGGQVLLSSKDNATDAIKLTTNVGVSETIQLLNTLGTTNSGGANPAIGIVSTAGGIGIGTAAAGKDITLSSALGSVVISGQEADAGAVTINAQSAGAGIDMNAGTGGVDLSSAGAVGITAAAASNFTTTAANLTVSTATSGELIISSAAVLDIDSAGAMELNSQETIVIGAVDDSSFIVDKVAKDLSLAVTGGGAQVLQLASAGTGTDAIDINATAGGVDVVAAGAVAISAADASNFTTTAGDLTLEASGDTNKVIAKLGKDSTNVEFNVQDDAALPLFKVGGTGILSGTLGMSAKSYTMQGTNASSAQKLFTLSVDGGVLVVTESGL